jgi:hypothetical protein
LDEIVSTGTEMIGHRFQVPVKVRRREVEQRIDRADGTVEHLAEVEVGHVGRHNVATISEPLARQRDHFRRRVDADHLEAAQGERLEDPSGPATRLQHASTIRAEPVEQPRDLGGDVPVERDVVQIRVVRVELRHESTCVPSARALHL